MENKYINDLKEIKEMMNRSSRFISISGMSGISMGIIALAGAYIASRILFLQQGYLNYNSVVLSKENLLHLFAISLGTLILAIASGMFFTSRETKKRNQKVWDAQSKRLFTNLSISLVSGGILLLIFLFKGFIGILLPLSLIFYGLALVNASKYTLNEVRSLGILELILGLIGLQFIGLGLIVWALGFGVLHIVYGKIIQSKYKS